MMMYELHLPLVMLANRSLQRGPGGGANPDQIKADLKVGLVEWLWQKAILPKQCKQLNAVKCYN